MAKKETDGALEKESAVVEKKSADNKADNKKEGRAKAKDKDKKPNIFVRLGRRLKGTFSELKRVTWPSFGKAVKATGIVLVIVLIFTVLVTAVNYGLAELLELITTLGA